MPGPGILGRTRQDQGNRKNRKQEKHETQETQENNIKIVQGARIGNTGEHQTGPGETLKTGNTWKT